MLPNLIIIGAQKCGTTSLHYYLSQHPDVFMSREKELDFFSHHWAKGRRWYEAHFEAMRPIHGESSPAYSHYTRFPNVPERMAALIPNAKLIYMVRDPIDRIISHWVHQVAANEEDRSLAEVLQTPDNWYVMRSRYYEQLTQYLPFYAPSQIMMMSQESLDQDRRSALKRIFRFLEIDDTFESRTFDIIKHDSSRKRRKTKMGLAIWKRLPILHRLPTRYRSKVNEIIFYPLSHAISRPILPPEQRAALVESLRDDVTRLRAFTGNSFSEWSL